MSRAPSSLAEHDDEDQAAIDARSKTLLEMPPVLTAFRVTSDGRPFLRMDLHVGQMLLTASDLEELFASLRVRDLSMPETDDEAQTVYVPAVGVPDQAPDGMFFDPERDFVIAFRLTGDDPGLAISCSGSVTLYHDYSGTEGKSYYFYWFTSDMISGVVGPNRTKSTDPDLYLYYWNDGNVLLDKSTYDNRLDDVGGFNTACHAQSWKIRVRMVKGGVYSLVVHTWWAN